MLRRRLVPINAFLILASMLAISRVAGAQEAPSNRSEKEPSLADHFARPGRVVLDKVIGVSSALGGLGASWFNYTVTREGTDSMKVLSVSPSVDVFVSHHWSIGGTISVFHQNVVTGALDANSSPPTDSYDLTNVAVIPRVGYAILLGDQLLLWPRVALGFSGSEMHSQQAAFVSGPSQWLASLDVPFVFAITKNVFLSAGPEVRGTMHSLADPALQSSFSVGVNAGIGLAL